MDRSPAGRLVRRIAICILVVSPAACIEYVRVPLAVPLPAVGGSRPASPTSLQLIGEFGDGLWGQEQERAEMVGGAIGFSLEDRVELSAAAYETSRKVGTDSHDSEYGETTTGVRGKIRIGDFREGRASLALHIAYMGAERARSDVQDERLTALDIALPVELYRSGPVVTDTRFGLYAAPRLVFQTFEDRLGRETTKGTMAAALVGVVARWRWFATMGELNFARTPTMSFSDATFPGGWILLPMMSVRGIIPLGD